MDSIIDLARVLAWPCAIVFIVYFMRGLDHPLFDFNFSWNASEDEFDESETVRFADGDGKFIGDTDHVR